MSSLSSAVSMSTHAPFAASPSRLKSSALPLPPSTSCAAFASTAVEKGLATTCGSKLTAPVIVAKAAFSCHWNGISKSSVVTLTSAWRSLSAAHTTAFRLAAEPVGRPPMSSVSSRKSSMTGVSPNIAAINRSTSSSAAAGITIKQQARALTQKDPIFLILPPGNSSDLQLECSDVEAGLQLAALKYYPAGDIYSGTYV